MRFVADAMLGRLAKWLRFLGFDTVYRRDITDSMLLRIARQDERVILTRDTHFLRKDIKECLFINSDNLFEQLTQVIVALNLKMPDAGRCSNCNGPLSAVERKQDIEGSVPEYIYISLNRFMKCNDCGGVFWEGSHYRNMRERLKGMLKDAENEEGAA